MKKIDFNTGWTVRPLSREGEAVPVTLPHDAMRTERRVPDSLGEANIGFFEGGDYEYRKVFVLPAGAGHLELEFEGVYHDPEITVNGRKLDAPTINMFFPEGVIVPRHGVYAAKVVLPDGETYPAVTNIGIRPTFSSDGKVSVESHLIGFEGNLYGVPTRIDFYHFIRPEVKFDGFDELSAQIRKDAEAAADFFEEQP